MARRLLRRAERKAMKRPKFIPLMIFVLSAVGAALFVALLLRHGVKDIVAAIAAAGVGVLAVVAFHFIPLLIDALAWKVLFAKSARPRLRSLFWMRWAGEAISTLLPFAQVGGDIIRARIAAAKGSPMPLAAATVLADI